MPSNTFVQLMVLFTSFPVLTHPNKMGWQRESIDTSLSVPLPCYLSQLPPSYWSYVVSTAIHVINRLPTPILQNFTPWELLFKSKLDITHQRSFGCTCFPLLRSYNSHKLLPHTTPCIFLGYLAHTKGYICQDLKTSWIYISRHVHFNEHEFFTPQSLTTGPSTTSSA